ncbi:MAG: hypothetical protein ACREPH_04330 [Rhodanobacteraceae bacterium]
MREGFIQQRPESLGADAINGHTDASGLFTKCQPSIPPAAIKPGKKPAICLRGIRIALSALPKCFRKVPGRQVQRFSTFPGEVETLKAMTRVPTRARLLAACTLLATFAFGSNASADVVRIHFSGAAGSGYADLTLQSADPHDTVNENHVPKATTGASGTFNGVKITGVRAIDPAPPPPGEVLPASCSLLGIQGVGATTTGSPARTCSTRLARH